MLFIFIVFDFKGNTNFKDLQKCIRITLMLIECVFISICKLNQKKLFLIVAIQN